MSVFVNTVYMLKCSYFGPDFKKKFRSLFI